MRRSGRGPLPALISETEAVARRIAQPVVIALDLVLAATAVMGSIFLVPGLPPSWLEATPFDSYFFPAFVLNLLGALALIGAVAVTGDQDAGVPVSLAAGLGVVVYEIVQIALLTLRNWLEAFGIAAGHRVVHGFPAMLWIQAVYIMLGIVLVLFSLALRDYRPKGRARERRP